MYRPHRRRRFALWATGGLVVFVAFTAAALVYTGRPQFCRSCHLMETRYVSWERSAHAPEADCLDCHSEPGFLGEIAAHLNGARYLYVLVTGREQIILRGEVSEGTCVECHAIDDLPEQQGRVDLAHDTHVDVDVPCERCHRGFHDEVAEGGRMRSGLGVCTECHPPTILRGVDPGE